MIKLPHEIGLPGLNQHNGYISEEILRQLQGDKFIRVMREMRDNDPVVNGMLFAVDMAIRQMPWDWEGKGQTRDFVEECLGDMSHDWESVLSEIMTMLVFGWSYFETVYKLRTGRDSLHPGSGSAYDDGKIGWRKWAPRAQETRQRWDFDEDGGGLLGMWQLAPPSYRQVFIPIEKSLLFRTVVWKGNPEGRSVLRGAYRPWYIKKRIEEIEAIGIERDLAGIPVATLPAEWLADGATVPQKATVAKVKEIVRNLKRNEQEGVVWPTVFDDKGNSLFKLELLSTGGRRQLDIDKTIARYNQEIAMCILADFILMGHEQVGSYALGSAKVDMFTAALKAWADAIAGIINSHAIPRLLKLNNMPLDDPPRLIAGDVSQVDLGALGQYITALSGAGATLFPDDDLEDHLRQIARLPVISEDVKRQRAEDAELKQEQAEAIAAGQGAVPGQPAVPGQKVPPVTVPPGNGKPAPEEQVTTKSLVHDWLEENSQW